MILLKKIVRRYIQERVKIAHLTPASILLKTPALRSFAKDCVNENIIKANFMIGSEKPTLYKKLPTSISMIAISQTK